MDMLKNIMKFFHCENTLHCEDCGSKYAKFKDFTHMSYYGCPNVDCKSYETDEIILGHYSK